MSTDKQSRVKELEDSVEVLNEIVTRMQDWIDDLHSGMYINCVYCGHRYGPKEDTPSSMADVLKEHVEKCPAHPMSKLKQENLELRGRIAQLQRCPRPFNGYS